MKPKEQPPMKNISDFTEDYVKDILNRSYGETGSIWAIILDFIFLVFATAFFIDELNWHYGLGAFFFFILLILRK